jgi:hypothetical protein
MTEECVLQPPVCSCPQSQLRTQLLDQLRQVAGPDAVRGPGLTAAAAADASGRRPDQAPGALLALPHTAGGGVPRAPGASSSSSMWQQAARCMVAEYLQSSGCLFSLSVFRCV